MKGKCKGTQFRVEKRPTSMIQTHNQSINRLALKNHQTIYYGNRICIKTSYCILHMHRGPYRSVISDEIYGKNPLEVSLISYMN